MARRSCPTLSLFFLTLVLLFIYRWSRSIVTTTPLLKKYDYIIIGAGSAGSVLASRLSENPRVSILLLEAGKEESIYTKYPLFTPDLQTEETSWEFRTIPQKKACLGLINKVSNWPRGKVIGGSSSINYMQYVRGNKYDYDSWAKTTGSSRWSYDRVLPYFIKSEGNRSPFFQHNDVHGTEGPLIVEDSPHVSPITDAFLQTARNIGYQIKDYNDGHQQGFRLSQFTTKDGTRMSSAKAFLIPAAQRKNLHIVTEAFVQKILINWMKKAEGVVYSLNSKTVITKARREIILSAGTVSTPQMLMLSGVGPRKHLRNKKVEVVHGLPGVGLNLQDHIMVPINIPLKPGSSLVPDRTWTLGYISQYFMEGKGPFATSGTEALGFLKTKYSESDYPDIQIHFFTHGISGGGTILKEKYGLTDQVYNKLAKNYEKKDQATFFVTLLKPKSMGTIKLRSNNPHDHPEIDPNYLSEIEDVNTLKEGIKISLNMSNTAPFTDFRIDYKEPPLTECEHVYNDSDKYWECYIRHLTLTVYHSVGTCKMGAKDDSLAVVDPELRVRGIAGLRVADASVMPSIPSGNTNAPTIMLGEKAADLMKLA